MTIADTLISGGWYKFDECHCGGVHQQKYKHPLLTNIMIKNYPKKEKFIAFKGNMKLKEGNFEHLQIFIQEIFTPAA